MSQVPPRLARCAERLIADDPLAQAIPFRAERWSRTLDACAHLKPVLDACTTPEMVTRADLAAIGRSVVAGESPPERLLLATMIWGFGGVGYGPYRTKCMLDDLQGRDRLRTTIALLSEGKLSEAYAGFRVRMCGPAFFTKFFYAVGLGAGLDPLPLVLDSQVAVSLRQLHDDGAVDVSTLVRGGRSVMYFPEGYARYVALLNGWARELGCRPDAIERLLFERPAVFREPLIP